jgi:hypothetical protein
MLIDPGHSHFPKDSRFKLFVHNNQARCPFIWYNIFLAPETPKDKVDLLHFEHRAHILTNSFIEASPYPALGANFHVFNTTAEFVCRRVWNIETQGGLTPWLALKIGEDVELEAGPRLQASDILGTVRGVPLAWIWADI